MSNWVSKLDNLMARQEKNIDEMVEESIIPKSDDIGMINPKSGAGIMAKENGVLEGFSYYNLGFRFDPRNMSLTLVAPNIKLFCNNFQVYDNLADFDPIKAEYQEVLKMIGGQASEV
jgi:hypothetical protein